MRFNDVAWFLKRVRIRRRIEQADSLSSLRIKLKPGIGASWPQPKLYDFAVQIQQLINVHLFPVMKPAVASVRIDPAEGDVRIPHGL